MSGAFQFKQIHVCGRPAGTKGILRFAADELQWTLDGKKENADNSVLMSRADIKAFAWLSAGRQQQLRVSMTDGRDHRFDGFSSSDFERVEEFVDSTLGMQIDKVENIYTKGSFSGTPEFNENVMQLEKDNKVVFDMPLQHISAANMVIERKEVALEFNQDDGQLGNADESLLEMRVVFGNESTEDDVKEVHEKILELADLRVLTGDMVASLEDVRVVVPGPRGKYAIELYEDFLKVREKNGPFERSFAYENVSNIFLLLKTAVRGHHQRYVVIGLDPPMRKGASVYGFLVMLCDEDDEIDLDINLSEDKLKALNLEQTKSGRQFEVVADVLQKVSGKNKVISCHADSTFRRLYREIHRSSRHAADYVDSIPCSHNADPGDLYPLESCLLFLMRPCTLISIKDIEKVVIDVAQIKITGQASNFGLKIKLKNGTTVAYGQIKEDFEAPFKKWAKEKRIMVEDTRKMRSEREQERFDADDAGGDENQGVDAMFEDSDESDDESFKAGDSEDEPDEEFNSDLGSDDSGSEISDEDSDEDYGAPAKKKSRK